ncbi:SpoIIE family protein phosphatase [Streptomyces sp. NPDC001595]|uniref:SpoIIE family protein phosphatase n=1 Tax=Streptomyces sp. NPDC001532 TaxID=3154520 RepID=UPI00331AA8A5
MVTSPRGEVRAATASEAVAVVDVHGLVTGWSEGARRLTGYDAEQVTGRPAADLVDGDAGTVRHRLAGAGTAVVGVRHRDGRRLELALWACPLGGAGGEPAGCVITAAPDDHEPPLGELAFRQAPVALSLFDTGMRPVRGNETAAEFGARSGHGHGFLHHLARVAETGRPVRYEQSRTRSPSGRRTHAWNVEMWPVRAPSGELIGTALAAFDSSEQHGARQRLEMLNEAAACLGTELDVFHTARELAELAVPRLADIAGVDLLEPVLEGEEPDAGVLGADPLLRRVAHRSVGARGAGTDLDVGAAHSYPPASAPARALATGEPVLTGTADPALATWLPGSDATGLSLLAVPLVARDTTLGVAVLVRDLTAEHPEPFDADDVFVARELVGRAAVCVDNARRYTRERTTALALQRSLLPQGVAGQAAVECASRYLPALSPAGAGGDWFDVIPLSGSRVALVVGDVAGHGIHASVTMGRLRTAVWTLADVDLPPDELLTHLDDLVGHLAGDGHAEAGEIAATCLYAVYDPVVRRCTLAAAGQPAPVVRLPDGTVQVVEMTAGPMLGVGGLPFEATELELPEGALLALYTDGLVEARDLDGDRGTAALCAALTAPADSLEEVCDTVLKSLLPDTPVDDVALLVARTRALDADQFAVWDLPADPAEVATARQHVTEQLQRWGLEEAAFVTELVASELVTNAIRYGGAPIQLRLIRDHALICEVSDASNTSPHLRRARTFDEGGRGLLLVAQLTRRWGSRPSGTGKTIWAEQPLPGG